MQIKTIQQDPVSQKILSGENCILNLAFEINKEFSLSNSSILIITSNSQIHFVNKVILPQFETYHCGLQVLVSKGEPACTEIDKIRGSLQKIPKLVIGIGGGSAIDYAKALAGLLLHSGPSSIFLEGIGTRKFEGPALPMVAIPTTAGTGSECTLNTVLTYSDSRNKVWKKSIRHYSLLPFLVFLDPIPSLNLPEKTTLYCGLDALSQSLESYLSKNSTEYSDSFATDSIKKIFKNLPIVLKDPTNITARMEMLIASSNSGISLSLAGLGVVHGLAGSIGALTSLPHRHICAALFIPTLVLFGIECNEKEIEILSNKMKFLLPNEISTTDLKNGYQLFSDYMIEWINQLIPIQNLYYNQREELIQKVIDQFSPRNHPTPFSKNLAKIALNQAFKFESYQ